MVSTVVLFFIFIFSLSVVLICISLMASDIDHPLVCLRDICMSSIFNWIVCLPGVELYEFFIYFGDQTLVQCVIGKYVFPYSQFPLHFADVFSSLAEAFLFDVVPLFIFSFISLALEDVLVKILLHGYLKFYHLCFPLGLLWCHNLYYPP